MTLLALRNDTIDTDQDGDIDAVRVVIVLNSTATSNELIVKLRGLHKEREVLETPEVAFVGQTNITVVYDAWSKGEHNLRLDFFDANGDFIASNPLPTFMLTPALRVPQVLLALNAGDMLQTGEACEITRTFADETGPRYGLKRGSNVHRNPFSVLDSQETLDCASWPAGDYELKETYRNGLGQTAESTLNFTIENRPAPAFRLIASGHENTTETPCSVRMELTDGRPLDGLTMVWRVKEAESINATVYDCSNLPAGAYLITLEVITDKLISSTEALNLIRLPAEDLSEDERAALPSISLGPETTTESVGWMSIGVLALIVSLLVFILLIRNPDPEPLELPSLGPTRRCCRTAHPTQRGCRPPWTTKGSCGSSTPTGRWIGGTATGASGTEWE